MDQEVNRFLEVRHADRSMEALRAYVRKKEENPNEYFFLIVAKDKNKKIGTINLSVYADRNAANFGYMIGDTSYWGGGTARQIKTILLDFAFLELNVHYVMGGVHASNTASHFNYRRMGFRMEAVLRNLVIDDPSNPTDGMFYGMLKNEWVLQKTQTGDRAARLPPATPDLIIDSESISVLEVTEAIIKHHRQAGWLRRARNKAVG